MNCLTPLFSAGVFDSSYERKGTRRGGPKGDNLGDDEGERDHFDDRRDSGDQVDFGGLLQVDGASEQTEKEELDGQMRLDDGSGKETGESDSVCDLLDQRAC
jgi:hypothetical protein